MGHHAVKVHLHDTHSALVLQHSFAIISDMIWNLYQGVETLKKKRRKSEWCISSEKDILKMSQYFSQLYNKSQWGLNCNVILDPTAFQSMLLWMVLVMKSSYQWWAHQVSGIPNILLCLSIPAVEGVSESLLQGQNQLIKHDHFRSLQIYKIHIFFTSERSYIKSTVAESAKYVWKYTPTQLQKVQGHALRYYELYLPVHTGQITVIVVFFGTN